MSVIWWLRWLSFQIIVNNAEDCQNTWKLLTLVVISEANAPTMMTPEMDKFQAINASSELFDQVIPMQHERDRELYFQDITGRWLTKVVRSISFV